MAAVDLGKIGQLPGGMAWAIGHPVAYFELIELALWLEVLCDREGFAALLRSLKRDRSLTARGRTRVVCENSASTTSCSTIRESGRPSRRG
jgi:hypothetical protein